MTRFQKWLLWGSSTLTALTGIVYWWMDHMMEPLDEWAVINHPLQPWMLKAHILVAPALVFAVGLIATDHIWPGVRRWARRRRRSGLVTFSLLAPMVASGYLIQVVTSESWLGVLAWIHVVTGVIYLLGSGVHFVARPRRTPSPEPAPREPTIGERDHGVEPRREPVGREP